MHYTIYNESERWMRLNLFCLSVCMYTCVSMTISKCFWFFPNFAVELLFFFFDFKLIAHFDVISLDEHENWNRVKWMDFFFVLSRFYANRFEKCHIFSRSSSSLKLAPQNLSWHNQQKGRQSFCSDSKDWHSVFFFFCRLFPSSLV